ncbi:unnamed protein product, partial [Vitis vinifera]|uniref:NAD(P)H dehydrogenase (quinone) n=1 Tax=Vitis vinifera TaxID=29760 RepID=D7UBN0_VITVI
MLKTLYNTKLFFTLLLVHSYSISSSISYPTHSYPSTSAFANLKKTRQRREKRNGSVQVSHQRCRSVRLALCGSLRSASFNRGLIRYAMKLSKEAIEGMEIEYVDISPLPLLNTDLIVGGKFPPAVEAFRQQILKADGVLFATAENNFSVSAPLKNALDWASIAPNAWTISLLQSSAPEELLVGDYHSWCFP